MMRRLVARLFGPECAYSDLAAAAVNRAITEDAVSRVQFGRCEMCGARNALGWNWCPECGHKRLPGESDRTSG
jgi:hypothetical protein